MTTPRPDLSPSALAEDIERIAREAGQVLLRYFEKLEPGHVEEKTSHRDLLSIADGEAERLVIERVKARFPGHEILGEESGFIEGTTPWCWVIDPLDGTTNFVRGFPFFAVSIGVLWQGRPFAGVVEAPRLGETFVGARGEGCWRNGTRMRVSATRELRRSLLATGFSYNRNEVERNNVDNFSALVLRAHDVRRAGAASIDLAFVAAGRFDAYWESYLKPWDVAAGALLVSEAGGRVTGCAGDDKPEAWLWHENLVSSNGLIHEELRAQLSGVEPGYRPYLAHFANRWRT